jgi:hypothetical protein
MIAITACFCALMLSARATIAILPSQIQTNRELLVKSFDEILNREQKYLEEREKHMNDIRQLHDERDHSLQVERSSQIENIQNHVSKNDSDIKTLQKK